MNNTDHNITIDRGIHATTVYAEGEHALDDEVIATIKRATWNTWNARARTGELIGTYESQAEAEAAAINRYTEE